MIFNYATYSSLDDNVIIVFAGLTIFGTGYGGSLGYGGGMYGRSSFGLARGGSSDLEV